MRVVVVGAGLGGLSAACHLAGRGHDVVVLEREDGPGGRTGVRRMGGYTFDTGATVLTMPGLVEDCFRAAGVDMADFVRLKPVDPMYRATFADGSTETVRAIICATGTAVCNWVSRSESSFSRSGVSLGSSRSAMAAAAFGGT